MTNQDTTKVLEPGKQTLNLPASSVAPELAPILRLGFLAVRFVRWAGLFLMGYLGPSFMFLNMAAAEGTTEHEIEEQNLLIPAMTFLLIFSSGALFQLSFPSYNVTVVT